MGRVEPGIAAVSCMECAGPGDCDRWEIEKTEVAKLTGEYSRKVSPVLSYAFGNDKTTRAGQQVKPTKDKIRWLKRTSPATTKPGCMAGRAGTRQDRNKSWSSFLVREFVKSDQQSDQASKENKGSRSFRYISEQVHKISFKS